MSRSIIHVDMDAFFASVEERERPELAGRPVVVGGAPDERGVVAAANYAARRYGVHSAMPSSQARRLCPHAVFLPPRHSHYSEVSQTIRDIFLRYTPDVEPLSVDEAFLDVAASGRLFGSAENIGRRIKADILAETRLVASVGVAPNKFLAKLASDHDKPDGFTVVRADGVDAFLSPLPVTRLWGVGKASARVFERLGIRTIGQLRSYPEQTLITHFGRVGGHHLWRLAHGLDDRPVVAEREMKSVSHETTFAQDIDDRAVLRGWLLDLSEQVAWRLRRHGLAGRTVHLKVRFSDFSTITRSRTLEQPTDITDEIWHTARDLFENRVPIAAVRLVGVGVSGFGGGADIQRGLFDDDAGRARSSVLDSTVDAIKARFGAGSMRRGGAAGKDRKS